MTGAPTERVMLDLPADPRHAATARVVVASVAADAGFSVDEIDDLRLALNEAVALLVDDESGPGPGDRIEVELHIGPGRVDIEVRRPGSGAVPEIDELADRILAAVVDTHVIGPGLVRMHKIARDVSEPGGR